jgi:flavin reductase (DIM6/NTAB) family NADH-FMN oxidoreductase RutF
MSELNGPRQVALVTCRHADKDNIITIAWHMPTSFSPNLYAISIGKSRFSHDMISKSGVFCVNFISAEHEDGIRLCGTVSGRDTEKFKESGFDPEECEKIDCPKIKQALGVLECRVASRLETGDHTIFVGEALKSELKGVVGPGKRLYHITGSEFATV